SCNTFDFSGLKPTPISGMWCALEDVVSNLTFTKHETQEESFNEKDTCNSGHHRGCLDRRGKSIRAGNTAPGSAQCRATSANPLGVSRAASQHARRLCAGSSGF